MNDDVVLEGHAVHADTFHDDVDTDGAPVAPLGHVVVVVLVLVPPLKPAPQAAEFVTEPATHVIGKQEPEFVTVVVGTAVPVEQE